MAVIAPPVSVLPVVNIPVGYVSQASQPSLGFEGRADTTACSQDCSIGLESKTRTSQSVPESNPRIPIALGVGTPIGVFLFLIALVFGIRRHRKNKRSTLPSPKGNASEENIPYLQKKGELDAFGNALYELDAVEPRCELEGDTEIKEMSTAVNVDGRRELYGRRNSVGQDVRAEVNGEAEVLSR
ncbi:MAG: hypothetical protein Q9169_006161 [Polycauliona sp. 2 TL-2023]